MLARRFCVYNAGLKVDAAQEILTVIMTSNDENVRSCKRHTVVRHAFCFWQSLCPFSASRLTTVSLGIHYTYNYCETLPSKSYTHMYKYDHEYC